MWKFKTKEGKEFASNWNDYERACKQFVDFLENENEVDIQRIDSDKEKMKKYVVVIYQKGSKVMCNIVDFKGMDDVDVRRKVNNRYSEECFDAEIYTEDEYKKVAWEYEIKKQDNSSYKDRIY